MLNIHADHFGLVILDECHRSYFGEWYRVLEHFAAGGAILLGLTATPADKETVNTDRFFTDKGQYQGPIYRYTIRQGETNPEVPEWERLASCLHFKFHTNVDLEGVHEMGFDFEPDELGMAVDVPERNKLIAEKYFEILGTREPVKTIVFAASIAHAKNLRYSLIVGRYCPHQADAIEHEKPEALINRLLELEEEITSDLQDLLAMVAVPSAPYTEIVAEVHPRAADVEEGYARESP